MAGERFDALVNQRELVHQQRRNLKKLEKRINKALKKEIKGVLLDHEVPPEIRIHDVEDMLKAL